MPRLREKVPGARKVYVGPGTPADSTPCLDDDYVPLLDHPRASSAHARVLEHVNIVWARCLFFDQPQLPNDVHLQKQVMRIVHQRPEPVLQVELAGGLINGVHLDGPNADLL